MTMKTLTQLAVTAALLGVSGISHAALTTTVGPVDFNGSASVTATANSVSNSTANNNNATVANVLLGQFDPNLGVLTGANLSLNSSRIQALSGSGAKSMGPGRTVPEPEEYAMMLLGFGMVGFQVKRKQQRLFS